MTARAFNCVCLYTTVDDDGTPVLGAATRTVIARPPTGAITVTRTVIIPAATATLTRSVSVS